MTDLLAWVKDQLRQGVPELRAVSVVADPLLVTERCGYPVAGVLARGMTAEAMPGDMRREEISVDVAVVQSVALDDETSLMGAHHARGLLALCDAVVTVLDGRWPEGYQRAELTAQTGTQAYTRDYDRFIAVSTVTIRYTRLVGRGG